MRKTATTIVVASNHCNGVSCTNPKKRNQIPKDASHRSTRLGQSLEIEPEGDCIVNYAGDDRPEPHRDIDLINFPSTGVLNLEWEEQKRHHYGKGLLQCHCNQRIGNVRSALVMTVAMPQHATAPVNASAL